VAGQFLRIPQFWRRTMPRWIRPSRPGHQARALSTRQRRS
jgi:hypothetical protein